MVTHVMVNANNNDGFKWVTHREYLINYLGATPAEADAYIKKQIKKNVG